MSDEKLVSIILPTYNGSRYLAESLDSVLAQSYQNWELIIVDDCSKDSTPQIIADYEARDPRIRGIRHTTNKKLPGGLNTGHAAARGEYLTWTSDDNRMLREAIAEMVAFLDAKPDVALVYADQRIINDAGEFVEDFVVPTPSQLAWTNSVGACFLYRRSAYEAVGSYDDAMFLTEDYDYWLRIFRQFDISPLHKMLYEYRRHAQSLTSKRLIDQWRGVERMLRRHLPHLRRASRQDRARGWLLITGLAMRRKAFGHAACDYIRAVIVSPLYSIRYLASSLANKGLKDRFHFKMKH